jgi:hypothetical protein
MEISVSSSTASIIVASLLQDDKQVPKDVHEVNKQLQSMLNVIRISMLSLLTDQLSVVQDEERADTQSSPQDKRVNGFVTREERGDEQDDQSRRQESTKTQELFRVSVQCGQRETSENSHGDEIGIEDNRRIINCDVLDQWCGAHANQEAQGEQISQTFLLILANRQSRVESEDQAECAKSEQQVEIVQVEQPISDNTNYGSDQTQGQCCVNVLQVRFDIFLQLVAESSEHTLKVAQQIVRTSRT